MNDRLFITMLILLSWAVPAAADPPPPAAPGEPALDGATPEAIAKAKADAAEHFKKGKELFDKGSLGAALPELLRSRQLYSSRIATSHAAVCLQKLERFDEALDMYEILLEEFASSLAPDAKTAAQNQVITLRKVTGTIAIAGAEIGAAVIIDGRRRGEYPLPAPVNVLAGAHVVHLYKEGFLPFESTLMTAAEQTANLAVHLHSLVNAGRLRVTEQTGKKLNVVVDSFDVGETPWEGPIAVGEHAVRLRGEESYGTPPSRIAVRLHEKAELALTAEDLAASIRIEPLPAVASVAVDGFFVGRGIFEGRVRPGEHPIKVVADGYFPETQKAKLKSGENRVIVVKLRRDPSSSLWAKPGRFTLELGGGAPITPTFGGSIASGCTSPCAQSLGRGGVFAFHGGYELGKGFGFGITAGYLSMAQATTGRATELKAVGILAPNKGTVDDKVALRGFVAGAFGAIRLGERFPVRLRLGTGVVLGSVADTRTGQLHGRAPLPYAIGPLVESPSLVWFFLEPEVRLGVRFLDHLELSAGASALFLVAPKAPMWDPDHPVNAASDGYGRFGADTLTRSVLFALTPSMSVRYDF